MGLSIEPKSRRIASRPLGLFILIAVGLGLLWWQRDYVATDVRWVMPERGQVSPFLTRVGAFFTSARFSDDDAGQVKLVHSVVVTPISDAFTADFYLEDNHFHTVPDWTGIQNRAGIDHYVVQEGDTLWGIAAEFGLDVNTLRWSNPELERNPDLLAVGSQLVILPVIGAYHTAAAGESLEAIAETYGVAEIDIVNYPLNELGSAYTISPGDALVIPNGRKDIDVPPPELDLDYILAWPLQGRITQGYHDKHRAVDIGSVYGSGVYAAEGGTVVHAEWARTGYGFTVIIDHGNNRHTLYSHLKGALVRSGEVVERGQIIGAVGSTGNSTGPHVHFEVRENGQRANPLDYLRQF